MTKGQWKLFSTMIATWGFGLVAAGATEFFNTPGAGTDHPINIIAGIVGLVFHLIALYTVRRSE